VSGYDLLGESRKWRRWNCRSGQGLNMLDPFTVMIEAL
jgi:hypothetical protein